MNKKVVVGTEIIKDFQITLEDLQISDCPVNITGEAFIKTKKFCQNLFNRNFKGFDGSVNSLTVKNYGNYFPQRRFNNIVIITNKLLGTDFRMISLPEKIEKENEQVEYPINNDLYFAKCFHKLLLKGK